MIKGDGWCEWVIQCPAHPPTYTHTHPPTRTPPTHLPAHHPPTHPHDSAPHPPHPHHSALQENCRTLALLYMSCMVGRSTAASSLTGTGRCSFRLDAVCTATPGVRRLLHPQPAAPVHGHSDMPAGPVAGVHRRLTRAEPRPQWETAPLTWVNGHSASTGERLHSHGSMVNEPALQAPI